MPKLMPYAIKSVKKLEGDGGVGTVIQINFAAGPFKYEKHRTDDEIDIGSHFSKHTLIEGDLLVDKLDSIVFEVKFEASRNGGCIVKITSHNSRDLSLDLCQTRAISIPDSRVTYAISNDT
ncbi:hypothetical protein GIB67_024370 [Kingdonia uniflora]|uniref:Bet v I/Major latex protein domain-containing protein n=1 Tax=Kingdonia uniflora TaxID=39325 RepID=A0A7J7LF40_9MAGN|nr:hypothetical protein GIB67_024370 [Kingdonia uniflora]